MSEDDTQATCRIGSCAGVARGALGFCWSCHRRYRLRQDARDADVAAAADRLLGQIPAHPGLSSDGRRALAERVAVYALRAGAGADAEIQKVWVDLALIDLAEDATKRLTDLERSCSTLPALPADFTEIGSDWSVRS